MLPDCVYTGCSTKAGFIADDIADNLLVKTEKYGGISKGDIVGGNCIHPNCLKASLSRSLVAMRIGSVSAYLILLKGTAGTHDMVLQAFNEAMLPAKAACHLIAHFGAINSTGYALHPCRCK